MQKVHFSNSNNTSCIHVLCQINDELILVVGIVKPVYMQYFSK